MTRNSGLTRWLFVLLMGAVGALIGLLVAPVSTDAFQIVPDPGGVEIPYQVLLFLVGATVGALLGYLTPFWLDARSRDRDAVRADGGPPDPGEDQGTALGSDPTGARGKVAVLLFGGSLVALLVAAWMVDRSDINLPEVTLTLLLLAALVILLVTIAALAVVISEYGLAGRAAAFGLPPGTVRAIIALGLVLIFAILSVFLLTSTTAYPNEYVSSGLTRDQFETLTDIVEIDSTKMDDDGNLLYDVRTLKPAAEPSETNKQLTLQLMSILGTLIAAVIGFYFGARGTAQPEAPTSGGGPKDSEAPQDGPGPNDGKGPEVDDADEGGGGARGGGGAQSGGGPKDDKPKEDKPKDDKPKDDKPKDEKPKDEKPKDEKPKDDKPKDDKPKDDKPRVMMIRARRPKHQKQLNRAKTGSVDCGPRSWQMGIDVQTGGAKRPGPRLLRERAGKTGAVTTNVSDAKKAVESFKNVKGIRPLKYVKKEGRPWAEAEKALRRRRAVHMAISYDVINKRLPGKSGDPNFNGGHSVLLFGIRKKPGGNGWLVGVNDPLADGRRPEIPEGRQWWPLGVVRHAAGKLAGRNDRFYGGIFKPGLRVGETDPPDASDEAEDKDLPLNQDTAKQGEDEGVKDAGFDDSIEEDDETAIEDGDIFDEEDELEPGEEASLTDEFIPEGDDDNP